MNNTLFIENIFRKLHKNIFLDKFIYEFIESLENEDQQVLIYKLYREYDSHKIYLVDIIHSSDNLIILKILGGKNNSKNTKRNIYTVILNKNEGNFVCNCKDFNYRCKSKNGYVCKHISFLVCKVANIFDKNFFKTLKLDNENITRFRNTFEKEFIWKDSSISVKYVNDNFKQIEFNSEDLCPICYDHLGMGNNEIIKCLKCENSIHKQCMEIWLEINNSCVCCRDTENWKKYVKIN